MRSAARARIIAKSSTDGNALDIDTEQRQNCSNGDNHQQQKQRSKWLSLDRMNTGMCDFVNSVLVFFAQFVGFADVKPL